MLGMGWTEIFVIVIVALLVIGPEKLPEVARTLAKGLRQVQKVVSEVRNSVNLEDFESRTAPPRPRPTPTYSAETGLKDDETDPKEPLKAPLKAPLPLEPTVNKPDTILPS